MYCYCFIICYLIIIYLFYYYLFLKKVFIYFTYQTKRTPVVN